LTFGLSSKDLGPLLLYQLLLCCERRIGIHPGYEIPIALEQAGGEDTGAHIQIKKRSDGTICQIGFFEDLSAHARFLGKEPLELHHETSFFVQDLKDLIGRCRHVVKIIGDDVWGGCGDIG